MSLLFRGLDAIKEVSHCDAFDAGGKLAIVNLQKTCKDRQADLVVNAKCDDVMRTVIEALGLQLPVYERMDSYVLECSQVHNRKQTSTMLSLLAADGLKCPLPMLMKLAIRIQVRLHLQVSEMVPCSCRFLLTT